jgi:hypothetical protein
MGGGVGIRTRQDGKDGTFMQRVLEYHRFAEDCRKLAESQVNLRDKQKLQEMAAAWDMLALERKLELDEKSAP